jgi:hypothetical protein
MIDFLSEDKEAVSSQFVLNVQQKWQTWDIVYDIELSYLYSWDEALREWIQIWCYYLTKTNPESWE